MRINIQINNVPEIFGRGGGGEGVRHFGRRGREKASVLFAVSLPSPPPHKQIPKFNHGGGGGVWVAEPFSKTHPLLRSEVRVNLQSKT